METPSFIAHHKRWLLPVLVILLAILVFFGLAAAGSKPPPKPEPATAALVNVKPVEVQSLQLTVRSQGLVTPKYQTELVAQVSGELIKVADAFMRGGFVKKGQLLAAIDPTNYEVQVQGARAKLASAKAALELEQAKSQVAKAEWSQVNDTPAPALGLRKPQLAQAEAQVTAARAALKQAQENLSRTRITAPYDALVAARDVSLGSFVTVGTRLGLVLGIRRAEVRLPIASSELQYLEDNGVGARVTLHSDALPSDKNGQQGEWQAHILRSERIIDRDSRMTYLVAGLADPYLLLGKRPPDAGVLPFGSYVVAHIQGITLQQAVKIPRYLIRDGRVAVAKADKLTLKPITVLRNRGGSSIVVDGLNAGDRLITTSLEFPVEGMALDVRAPEPLAANDVAADNKDKL